MQLCGVIPGGKKVNVAGAARSNVTAAARNRHALGLTAAPTHRRAPLRTSEHAASRDAEIAHSSNAEASKGDAFCRLLADAGASGVVTFGPAPGVLSGHGLFTTIPAVRGQVLLSIPRSKCIVVDYGKDSGGISVPEGRWPRLRKGLERSDPLPWDVLQVYTNEILPQPEDLTLPMCWDEGLLRELQHPAISAAAQAQQERLRALLPGLSKPIGPGLPSFLQWAFACVRSRAFKLGNDAYAFAPFLDCANHAAAPTSDFGATPDGSLVLVALQPLAAGQEVTISYSGPQGYTNQRFQAQYGFVPLGGNPADRVELASAPDAGTLRLSYLQHCLGDAPFMDTAAGRNSYFFAALKSLPLADEASESLAGGEPATPEAPTASERALASALSGEVAEQLLGCATSLGQDEQMLEALGEVPAAREDADGRLLSALLYRRERKRLLHAVQELLTAYQAPL